MTMLCSEEKQNWELIRVFIGRHFVVGSGDV